MEDSIHIAQRLKSLREQKGCKQEEVARAIMVTPQAYSQYERGQRRPSYEVLIRLKTYYQVTLDYLLCGEKRWDGLLYDQLVFTEASRLPSAGKDELFHFMQFLSEKYHI